MSPVSNALMGRMFRETGFHRVARERMWRAGIPTGRRATGPRNLREMPMAEAEKLRHAIDSGRTGEKVRGPDFAAAPLGTDDEAAGSEPQRAAPAADWVAPQKGDRIVDGDPSVGALYEPQGEEDNRAPATAPPSWRTWAMIGLGLMLLGVLMAVVAG